MYRLSVTRRRSGNIVIVVVGVLAVALSLFLLYLKTSAENTPLRLNGQRYVLADIADFEDLKRLSANPSSDTVVTMRDEANGNYLLLNLVLRQEYLHEKGFEEGMWNSIRAEEFRLVSDDQESTGLLLITGYSAEKQNVELLSLPNTQAMFRESDGTFKIDEGDGHPAFADDSNIDPGGMGVAIAGIKMMENMASMGGTLESTPLNFHRADLRERLDIIRPPTLKGNVWQCLKTYAAEDAWVGIEVNVLFPIPRPGSKAKFMFANDEQNAIMIDAR